MTPTQSTPSNGSHERINLNIRKIVLAGILGGILAGGSPMALAAEPEAPLDVFAFPSIQHMVLIEGGGYFPILNNMGNDLYAVFRTGGGHLGRGGALVITHSLPDTARWSPRITVVDGPEDDRNPAVGFGKNNRIIVGYHEQGSYTPEGKYQPSLNKALCKVTLSDDLGNTWSTPQPLGIAGLETCSPYGRIISLPDGTLLMNVYGPYTDTVPGMEAVDKDQGDYAYLVRSTDNGQTWKDPSLILAAHNETALLRLSDGRLLAVSRGSTNQQRLDYTLSLDEGRTWSEPLRLTGPSQHPADLIPLSNGWILMLFGDRSGSEHTIKGIISRDHALSWDVDHTLILSRPVKGDFGYPSGVLLPNGNLAYMYYWAGPAKDAYDYSQARGYVIQFKESDLIAAYEEWLGE
ncbi:MAG TPA: sialidase family protein [bacterium]|nr:sialidase family protein [bacterium]